MPAFILLLIFIPVFWLLIVRPQQQRQKAHAELVGSLQPGDRVEAFSGIHGTLVEVHEQTVRMEVAPDVVVTMARLAVASRIDDGDGGASAQLGDGAGLADHEEVQPDE